MFAAAYIYNSFDCVYQCSDGVYDIFVQVVLSAGPFCLVFFWGLTCAYSDCFEREFKFTPALINRYFPAMEIFICKVA